MHYNIVAMDFPTWLAKQMDRKNLSQSELARRIGVTRQAVNHLLSGATDEPSVDTLKKLAEILGVPIVEVLRVAYDLPINEQPETEWGIRWSKKLERFPPEFRAMVEAVAKAFEELEKKSNGKK